MIAGYIKRNARLIWVVVIIASILLTYAVWSERIRAIETLSLRTNDLISLLCYKMRPVSSHLKHVTIVAIDDVSLKYVDKRWPWPRKVLIEILEKIERHSPNVIGVDLALIGESTEPQEDLELAQLFKKYNNTVIASHFAESGEYIRPKKIFRESTMAYGHINMPRDRDLVIRKSQPVVTSKTGKLIDFSFEVKTAAKFLGIPSENIFYYNRNVILKSPLPESKNIIFAVDKKGSRPINFTATEKTIKTLRAAQILKNEFSAEAIKGKVVLIGVTSEIFHDVYPTPLGIMPGVLLNANDLLMIINNNPLHRLPRWADFTLISIFCMFTIFLTYSRSIHTGIFISLFEITIVLLSGILLRLQDISFDLFGVISMIAISYVVIYSYKYLSLIIENSNLRREAITDGLTGLFVYRYFELKLHSLFNKAFIEKDNLSLAIIDIDHFKKLNDTYGHEEGNFVLRELSSLLIKISRRSDVTARYGGEEFCVILVDTNLDGAADFAENLRKQIGEKEFISPSGNKLKITASLGVASNKSEGVFDADTLTKTADAALYEAKNTGRDKVCKL